MMFQAARALSVVAISVSPSAVPSMIVAPVHRASTRQSAGGRLSTAYRPSESTSLHRRNRPYAVAIGDITHTEARTIGTPDALSRTVPDT